MSGIVKCGDCGANMVRKTVPSGKRKFIYEVCGNHKGNKNICSPHCINAAALEECVLKLLNHQIENITDLGRILDKLEDVGNKQGEVERRNRQITKKKEEIRKYNHLRLDLYEDYKDGLITKEEYLELKEIYEKRTQAAEQALGEMEVEMAFLADEEKNAWGWIKEFEQNGYLECLSRETVIFLIGQILVYEKKEGERYPRIEIHFKYADEFQASLNLPEKSHEETFLRHTASPSANHGEKEETYGKDE